MKKQLLLGSALLAAVTAFSQSARTVPVGTAVENTGKRIAARLAAEEKLVEATPSAPNYNVQNEPAEEPPAAARTNSFVSSWNIIAGSMNAYGVTSTYARPLQYDEDLNAVTFVHRGSASYPASPVPAANAKTGVVTAEITQNWGATWDSTLLWNNNTAWGRYPQGALMSAVPGNTNIANAFLVGNTAINFNDNWVGNGFFAKPMSALNNTAAATNSFIATLSNELGKTDFTIYDFQVTDNGKAHALGYINNNPNGSTSATFGYRGARVVNGTFVSGNMIWTGDSIIPSTLVDNGSKSVHARPRMAWSENGMVGYVMHIGVASTATLNNRGYQPIIHRTGDGGVSWVPVNGIDFNLAAMSTVTNMIPSPNASTVLTIPMFDIDEGIGMTVDKNNKLHITSVLKGTSAIAPDSLLFSYIFTNVDGQQYGYRHINGWRPYIFDFVGDGLPASPWSVSLIDSLSSEAPGTDGTTDPRGFATNPWDDVNGKVAVESRIQSSRTPDGNYIVYTWAESDTNFTSGPYFKWNELPNIKARLLNVTTGSLNPVEINVTKPGNGNPFIVNNSNVSSRAYLHYASPKCALAQTVAVGAAGPAILLPLTTSRPYGVPLQQGTDIVHRYMSAVLNFGGLTQNDIVVPSILTGISENALNAVQGSVLFPNPAKDNTNLALTLQDRSKVEISVINMMGQVVKSFTSVQDFGKTAVNIDLSGLSQGVYMVNVKIDNASSAKKLIVE